jgi:hypothetical protein
MTEQETIAANIMARVDAKDVIKMAHDLQGTNKRFWEYLREEALKHAPLPANPNDLSPMSEAEVVAFGSKVITFGQYAGARYNDVPVDYLEWLADQNSILTKYLRSTWVRRREGQQYDDEL